MEGYEAVKKVNYELVQGLFKDSIKRQGASYIVFNHQGDDYAFMIRKFDQKIAVLSFAMPNIVEIETTEDAEELSKEIYNLVVDKYIAVKLKQEENTISIQCDCLIDSDVTPISPGVVMSYLGLLDEANKEIKLRLSKIK